MIKRFYYDLETTGVLPNKHGIHQIAFSIWIDGEIKESHRWHVRPNPACQIDPEALQVCGVTTEQIFNYPPMTEVYNNLIGVLSKYCDRYNKKDKFTLCGYNICSFDNHFLSGFFKQNEDSYFGSWFWPSGLDMLVMATERLEERRHELEDFKLSTVCKFAGIEVKKSALHDAGYDLDLTIQLHNLMSPWVKKVQQPGQ